MKALFDIIDNLQDIRMKKAKSWFRFTAMPASFQLKEMGRLGVVGRFCFLPIEKANSFVWFAFLFSFVLRESKHFCEIHIIGLLLRNCWGKKNKKKSL